MYSRKITRQIVDVLPYFGCVLLRGCRYAGKTTIAQHLISEGLASKYITLDDLQVRQALELDAYGYLSNLPRITVIDEVQKMPEIFITLKQIIDEKRAKGDDACQFILTGSANVFLLPKLSESLAGRMATFNIKPLAQAEINENKAGNFIDDIFANNIASYQQKEPEAISDIISKIYVGGFAYAVKNNNNKIRQTFFKNYLTSLIERDIKEVANIEGLIKIPTILQAIASNVGNLNNYANLARVIGIKEPTLKNYINLLKIIYVVEELKPYYSNKLKRLVKTPKLYLNDTGLLCHINGSDKSYLRDNPQALGAVLENFVYNELAKLIELSDTDYNIYYLRNQTGLEVDFVIQHPNGRLCLIEVKSSANFDKSSITNMAKISQELGGEVISNIVLYTGKPMSINKQTHALPINCLWL
jgi:predicted AAA+ superfamily ATPase